MHYPPETATIMLFTRMIAAVNQAEDKDNAIQIFKGFCQRTVNEDHEIAHNLLGEKFVGQIDVLRVMLQNAVNCENVAHVSLLLIFLIIRIVIFELSQFFYFGIINIFENFNLKFQWLTPDGFRSLLALVGTNGQGIGTSAFSRWVKNVSALDLPEDQRIHVDKLIDKIYDDMDEGKLLFPPILM